MTTSLKSSPNRPKGEVKGAVIAAKPPRKAAPMGKIKIATSARAASEHTQWRKDFFVVAYKADQFYVVDKVKKGMDPHVVDYVAGRMHVTKEKLMQTLGLPRATLQRKVTQDKPLSVDASSRVFGISRIIGQVEAMVNESGDPTGFDAATWVAGWLERQQPALGGRKPAEFMDTAEGQQLVSRLLAQAQSGAYA
jgi:putative toxin-antitoxin system antitoxin component (TIGR02293 family)